MCAWPLENVHKRLYNGKDTALEQLSRLVVHADLTGLIRPHMLYSYSCASVMAKLLRHWAEESVSGHCFRLSESWRLRGRRLALQLLTARRSEGDQPKKAAQVDRRAPTAQTILQHRLALLAEVG